MKQSVLWWFAATISMVFWSWPTAHIVQDMAQYAKFGAKFDSVNVKPLLVIAAWSTLVMIAVLAHFRVKTIGIAVAAAIFLVAMSAIWPILYYRGVAQLMPQLPRVHVALFSTFIFLEIPLLCLVVLRSEIQARRPQEWGRLLAFSLATLAIAKVVVMMVLPGIEYRFHMR
jgi:hypothetical protein